MNCKCVSQKIDSYLDGELSGTEMLAIRSHLHKCGACTQEAESLRTLKSALASLPCCGTPEGLESRLIAAVSANSRPVLGRHRGLAWGSALLVSAAAGFLFVWIGISRNPAPSPAAGVAASEHATSSDVARDQAIFTGADPLSGQTMVVAASYGK